MPATNPVSYTSVDQILLSAPFIGSASNLTSALVYQYAGFVEAKMNAKLAKLYGLPFTAQIPLLTALATELSVFEVLSKRVTAQFTDQQNRGNPFISGRKAAWEMLDAIANGEMVLLDSSGSTVGASTSAIAIESTTQDYVPTFNEGPLENTEIDPSKLDDILAAQGLS